LNGLLKEYLESRYHVDEQDFVSSVKAHIGNCLASGRSDIGYVAAQLGFQPRTLQLRLKEQGTTFSDLLRDVRLELAETLLKQSDLSMTEIADRLGYRELSAFSRAFKAHCGMAPKTFRLRLNALS